ncbi:putative coiled-coil protein SlyX [Pedobacter sp. CAN_A7]|uniref:hypothetical protein n=1 Tax=Pedobacter sp. CAN_A7 TaxID=2787722 RepID=UPI0018C8F37E
MTYKELLQNLADQASENYKNYLQSKIAAQENTTDELLPQKTQQFKDTAELLEKKFSAVLATVKSGEELNQAVPDESLNDFLP